MAKPEEKIVSEYTRTQWAPGEIKFTKGGNIEIRLGGSFRISEFRLGASFRISDLGLANRLVIALGTIPEAAFQSYDQAHREESLRGKIVITPATFNRAPASILLVERAGAGAWTDAEIFDLCGSLEICGVILEQEPPEGSVVEFYSRVEAEKSSSLEEKMRHFHSALLPAVEQLTAFRGEPADKPQFYSLARGWAELLDIAFDVTLTLAECSRRFGLDTSELSQIRTWTQEAMSISAQWAEAAIAKLQGEDIDPSQSELNKPETDAPEPSV